jgi:hypothetical protein
MLQGRQDEAAEASLFARHGREEVLLEEQREKLLSSVLRILDGVPSPPDEEVDGLPIESDELI